MWPMIALVAGALLLFRIIRLPLQKNLVMLAAIGLVAYGVFGMGWLNAPVAGAASTAAFTGQYFSVSEAETYGYTDTLVPTEKIYTYGTRAQIGGDLAQNFTVTIERSAVEDAQTCKICFATDGVFRNSADTSDASNYEVVDRLADGRLDIDVNGANVDASGCRIISFAEGTASAEAQFTLNLDNVSMSKMVDNTERHTVTVTGCGDTLLWQGYETA